MVNHTQQAVFKIAFCSYIHITETKVNNLEGQIVVQKKEKRLFSGFKSISMAYRLLHQSDFGEYIQCRIST